MKIKDESKELSDLLQATARENSFVSSQLEESELPEELQPEPVFEFDYDKQMRVARKAARKSIVKIVKSVVPENFANSDYIKEKIDEDADQLGKLYYQQLTIETMQKANMEAVSKGNLSPRMFEVFTQLSKNHSDIAKQITEHQIVLRKTYIDIVFDMKRKLEEEQQSNIGTKAIEAPQVHGPAELNTFTSTKELIHKMHELKKKKVLEQPFEEVKD